MSKHLYSVGEKLVVRTKEQLMAAKVPNILIMQYGRMEIDVFAGMELTVEAQHVGAACVNIPWYNVEENTEVGLWHQCWFTPPTGEPEPEDERITVLKRWLVGQVIASLDGDCLTLRNGHSYTLESWWSGDDRDCKTRFGLSEESRCRNKKIADIRSLKLGGNSFDVDLLDADGEVLINLWAFADADDDDSAAGVSLEDENGVDINLASS